MLSVTKEQQGKRLARICTLKFAVPKIRFNLSIKDLAKKHHPDGYWDGALLTYLRCYSIKEMYLALALSPTH